MELHSAEGKPMLKKVTLLIAIVGSIIAAWTGMAAACGGFFCQSNPVDQVGERIVFTQNPDDTITTLIEILYQGSAEDFSWILPIPAAIDADALAVPEDGDLVFDELHRLTDVQFVIPELPDCADDLFSATAEVADAAADDGGVEVFASGEVGPFGFDVIGSEDRSALINWLRDNEYRVTPEMEPLLDIYVEQEFAFIAMRLLDGETSDSISPIEITYPGTEPMIPLQLTAVAAQRQMPIWVWLFGEHRATSTNFTDIEIATEELTFFEFGGSGIGGNDYTFLVQDRADALGGQAFITEFAREVGAGAFSHPWLAAQAETAPYLTRLQTYIDPEEMTADPTFAFDETLEDVSNIRDASDLTGLYNCERNGGGLIDSIFGGDGDAIDPTDGTGQVVAFTPGADADGDDVVEPDDGSIDADNTDGGETPPDGQLAFEDSNGDSSFGGTTVILLAVLGTVLLVGLGFAAGRGSKA